MSEEKKSRVDELFSADDLNEGSNREKLIFPENIPVKLKIVEASDGILEKSGYPYYVFKCKVLDGDEKGKDYDLFVNTKYKTKEGEEKGSHTFKKVLGGLAKKFSQFEIGEGRGNDLINSFKTQIDRVISHDIEVAFFKADKGFQNLIYVRDLSAKEEVKEEKKDSNQESNEENF